MSAVNMGVRLDWMHLSQSRLLPHLRLVVGLLFVTAINFSLLYWKASSSRTSSSSRGAMKSGPRNSKLSLYDSPHTGRRERRFPRKDSFSPEYRSPTDKDDRSRWMEFTSQVTSQGYSFCDNVTRPGLEQIQLRNKFWHYFSYGNTTTYVMGAYVDVRPFVSAPGGREIRIFPMAGTPIGTVPICTDLHIQLWYTHSERPVAIQCQCIHVSTLKFWESQGDRYGFSVLTCHLPVGPYLPTHVSLTHGPCDLPHTYLPLTVSPPKPTAPSPREVGLCVKPLFGNLTTVENASYLVNWLETLKALGVPQIHMYYDGLWTDDGIRRIFHHYIETGFLVLEWLPNNLYETDTAHITAGISQSIVHTVINDCFYRNLHRYWYIIHIDLDEILIPRKHNSYSEMAVDYFSQSQRKNDSCSLVSRSAYWYMYHGAGNSSAPDYMPFLRFNQRMPVEFPTNFYGQHTWNTKGTGVQKSLQNTESCLFMSIHACRMAAYSTARQLQMPASWILSHHYRESCKVYERCVWEPWRRVSDDVIQRRIGEELERGVRGVLQTVGYWGEGV